MKYMLIIMIPAVRVVISVFPANISITGVSDGYNLLFFMLYH